MANHTPRASRLSKRHICHDSWCRNVCEQTTRNATPLRLGGYSTSHQSLLDLGHLLFDVERVPLSAITFPSTSTPKHLHQNREKDRREQHTKKGDPDHTRKYRGP